MIRDLLKNNKDNIRFYKLIKNNIIRKHKKVSNLKKRRT